jgi:proline racemase
MVAAVLTESQAADFGAFFISSYVYLDMCGHGTIGLAKTLATTGQLDLGGRQSFTLETPAGVVAVDLTVVAGEVEAISLLNVPAYVEQPSLMVDLPEFGTIDLAIAYGGCRYGLVDAGELGWPLTPDRTARMCTYGAAIKEAAKDQLDQVIDSVLFHQDLAPGRSRHLVVLEGNKFDRSPCGTGSSARLAKLVEDGRLGVGDELIAEGVLGTSFRCRIESIEHQDGRRMVTIRITGQAYLTAFSTLVIEAGDPLAAGFLCR